MIDLIFSITNYDKCFIVVRAFFFVLIMIEKKMMKLLTIDFIKKKKKKHTHTYADCLFKEN